MAILPISSQYKYTGKGPFDAKALVKTYEELTSLDTWTLNDDIIAYNGMITAVWLNKKDTLKNGVYFLFDDTVTSALKKPDVTNEANWHRIASLSDIAAFAERLSDIETGLTDLGVRVAALEDNRAVITASTHFDFPSVGKADVIYKAESERLIYQWNASEYKYEVLGGMPDIEVIIGGAATV